MTKKNNDLESPLSKAMRLKRLRRMANVSMSQLVELHDALRLGTLKYWESAASMGITEKGASYLVEAMNKVGIACSTEWLLYGQGFEPYFVKDNPDLLPTIPTNKSNDEVDNRQQEINVFCQLHGNTVALAITDDAMLPMYRNGDVIAGIWRPISSIEHISDAPCIILTSHRHLLCRRLIHRESEQYDILALNQQSTADHLNLYNVRLQQAAPIVRVWSRIISNKE